MLEATNESGGSFARRLAPRGGSLADRSRRWHSVYLPLAIVAPSIPFESRVALPGEPFGSAAIACWPGDVDPWLVDPMAITEPIAITSE